MPSSAKVTLRHFLSGNERNGEEKKSQYLTRFEPTTSRSIFDRTASLSGRARAASNSAITRAALSRTKFNQLISYWNFISMKGMKKKECQDSNPRPPDWQRGVRSLALQSKNNLGPAQKLEPDFFRNDRRLGFRKWVSRLKIDSWNNLEDEDNGIFSNRFDWSALRKKTTEIKNGENGSITFGQSQVAQACLMSHG